IPAKSNTNWEVLDDESDDMVVRMRVSLHARTKCPEFPEFWEARAITVIDAQARKRVLLTSLRDRRRYKPLRRKTAGTRMEIRLLKSGPCCIRRTGRRSCSAIRSGAIKIR
ncbi:MAG: hypothetical protein V7606_131, partial [Burkholderiales bacterium]